MNEFDENEVVKHIRRMLPQEAATAYSDDDLLNIVDMIWDYYELNGLLDIDFDEEDEEETDIVNELIDYAGRMLKKDKACNVRPVHLEAIIKAELDYEDTLG
ncbi:MAG: hypothetical protein NC338_05400 [Firmicutes bacterium]|nr:hypothetical protein [Bacillota bacterium]MCM1400832.1 hypothetical protein [Bacteroides sp.]MCM1476677.1 hypothetical protein [Bacteroides sp.]